MSTFVSLGSRGPLTGGADTTGLNPGNWTATFTPQDINVNLPYFEVCHIKVSGAQGTSFQIYIDNHEWDAVQTGSANSWDPSVALPLNPGNYLSFAYSNPANDGHPPVVTIWLRYDQDILANLRLLT